MAVYQFPPIEMADENGLLAVGGDLEVDSLLSAYSQGIFPWPISKDYPLAWFSPNPRGLIFQKDLHCPRSLQKFIKKSPLRTTLNTAFLEVINHCANIHALKSCGTWITDEIITGYLNLFNAGFAYSVEVWNEEKLVGGIYGVHINSFVSGESMFFKESNASKLALVSLMQHLAENDVQWLDTQMVTPIISGFGGREVQRPFFRKILAESIQKKGNNSLLKSWP